MSNEQYTHENAIPSPIQLAMCLVEGFCSATQRQFSIPISKPNIGFATATENDRRL
jgi:hypothetical protein